MNLKTIVTTAAMLGALTMSATTASALAGAQAAFNAHYTKQDTTCLTCHAGAAAPKTHTQFGTDWLANGGAKSAGPGSAAQWTALDKVNNNLTTYGPVKSTWVAPVPAAPSAGGGGCIASSVTTPLMMVLAMLSLGFFVRRKKD